MRQAGTTRITYNLGTNQEVDVVGDLTYDVGGNITLDADGGNWYLKDGGTTDYRFADGTVSRTELDT